MDVQQYSAGRKWVIDASGSKIMIFISGYDRGDMKVFAGFQVKSQLIPYPSRF